MKKINNRKGFTLVELIVILVILAILAAILVPALIGWIQKSKQKKIMLNGSYAYKAAQTLASENYGNITWIAPTAEEVITLSDVPGTIEKMSFSVHGIVDTTSENPFQYKEDDLVAQYADGVWTILTESPDSGTTDPGNPLPPASIYQPPLTYAQPLYDADPRNKAVLDFLSSGWNQTVTLNGTDIPYKLFKDENGHACALVISNASTGDVSNLIEQAQNAAGTALQKVYAYSYDKESLQTQGLLNTVSKITGEKIKAIDFDSQGNVTNIIYKKN